MSLSVPRQKLRVVMVDQSFDGIGRVPRWVSEALRDAGLSFSYRQSASREELRRNASRADIVWVMGGGKVCSAENLDVLKRCFAVIRAGSGTDNVGVLRATELGIVVVNTPEAVTDEVADHTVALLLSVVRLTALQDRLMRRGRWERRPGMHRWHLSGQTLGLVGFGHVARRVAERLRGFNMKFIAFDPHVKDTVFRNNGVRRAELARLLSESDFVSLHCPLTSDTFHLIGRREFRLMKRNSVLINVSRGSVVDDGALIEALEKGRIGGAGLDVFEREPLGRGNRLLKFDNVVMTSHSAGWSDIFGKKAWKLSVESIIDLSKGYWPKSVVNKGVKPLRRLRINRRVIQG